MSVPLDMVISLLAGQSKNWTKEEAINLMNSLYDTPDKEMKPSPSSEPERVVKRSPSAAGLPPAEPRPAPTQPASSDSDQTVRPGIATSAPAINNPKLLAQIFTHSSIAGPSSAGGDDPTYEPLEFLGDAYIELAATRLLHACHPHLPVRTKATLRESLVCNENLAKYACRYGFDAKMAYVRVGMPTMSDKAWTKILGDVFEAYVAAVMVDDPIQGFGRIEGWLHPLFAHTIATSPTAAPVVAANTREFNIATAKAELNTTVTYPPAGASVSYREMAPAYRKPGSNDMVFTIGVYLTGWGHENRLLGEGIGSSKARAGQEAAFKALKENGDLLAEANRKRAQFELSRKGNYRADLF